MTDEALATLDRYEAAFGAEQLDSISAPNYIGQAAFTAALAEALKRGTPATLEELQKVLGEPAWEMMPS